MRRMKNGIALIAIILTACPVLVEAQRNTVKTKVVADFSVLTAFRDALLDVKGAVEAGVNRQDYQRKLQTATAESLKTETRISVHADKRVSADNYIVQSCFLRYNDALSSYKLAAAQFDSLINLRTSLVSARASADEGLGDENVSAPTLQARYLRVDSTEARVSEAEADLQASWSAAGNALDEAIGCTKTKLN
jgi:hypothetical protein